MRRLTRAKIMLLGLSGLIAAGCTTYSPQDIESILSLATSSAKSHLAQGRYQEAALLAAAAAEIDPGFPGLDEVRRQAAAASAEAQMVSLLGANRPLRYEVRRSAWERVLLWPVDRYLDWIDIFSFGIHLGGGLYADAHITRAVQLSAGSRGVAEAGWLGNRCLGGQVRSDSGVNILCYGIQTSQTARSGTSGEQVGSLILAGIHDPKMRYYQDYADYWAVGASATFIAVGGSVDVHPVQLVDFLAGFIGVDFLHDDLAHTRGLNLLRTDTGLLWDISKILGSEEVQTAYRRYRSSKREPEK